MNDWAIQLKNTKHIPVNKIPERLKGTTFQGYINISVNNLRKLFGEPTRKNTDTLKTYLEWDLECDGIIFAIYDYNTWDNENEIDPNERVNFHIGAHTQATVDFVERLITYNL